MQFSPVYHNLLVGSWDGDVALYNTEPHRAQRDPPLRISNGVSVTDVCWDNTGRRAFLGDIDGFIKEIDLENGNASQRMGYKHKSGVQSLVSVPGSASLIVSGSWDKSLQYIDTRYSRTESVELPGKVFALDSNDEKVVVAMDNRLVHIYDIRSPHKPLQVRESGLKYQTRSLKCMPNGSGYAQSSIEGRVAIEYFDPSGEVQAKKYAFKCHRLPATDMDLVSPVNALTFHKSYGTMFTAGSDCYVCLWDQVAKKRLRQYPKFDQSVVALDFALKDDQSSILAIGTSDDSFKTQATLNQPFQKPLKSKLYLKYLSGSEGAPKIKR